MIPVPFTQVFDFIDWINRNTNGNFISMSSDQLYGLAMMYLRQGAWQGEIGQYLWSDKFILPDNLFTQVLLTFQTCPMISESTILEQMKHFKGCGHCITYLRERGISPNRYSLQPLLKDYFAFAKEKGVVDEFYHQVKVRSKFIDSRDPENDDRNFQEVIMSGGGLLWNSFREFLGNYNEEKIRAFEQHRNQTSHSFRNSDNRSIEIEQTTDDGLPIGADGESFEISAQRLADSARFLITTNYYEDQIKHNPQVILLLRAMGVFKSETAQGLEFIWWLQEYHPNLNLLASMPSYELKELVYEFCEEKNYSNSTQFYKEVLRWLKGNGERNLLEKLIDIGRRQKRRTNSYRSDVSPFERYETVPFHAIYLFLSSGDFPEYITKYWEDLNYLTGDHIDIYYSHEDLDRKISAYETLSEFRSLSVPATNLPAILLWGQDLKDNCVIPLLGLSHEQIFKVTKLIVQKISEDMKMEEINKDAIDFISDLIDEALPGTKIIVKDGGFLKMGDKYEVGQAGIVGPNSQASNMIFNQVWSKVEKDVDLDKLADELELLRKQLKIEGTEPEHDEAIGAVASAQVAAKNGDGIKAMESLAKAGKWAFDVATKIGTGVAITALEVSLGL